MRRYLPRFQVEPVLSNVFTNNDIYCRCTSKSVFASLLLRDCYSATAASLFVCARIQNVQIGKNITFSSRLCIAITQANLELQWVQWRFCVCSLSQYELYIVSYNTLIKLIATSKICYLNKEKPLEQNNERERWCIRLWMINMNALIHYGQSKVITYLQ